MYIFKLIIPIIHFLLKIPSSGWFYFVCVSKTKLYPQFKLIVNCVLNSLGYWILDSTY